MTREEAIESFKFSNEQAKLRLEVEKMRMDSSEIKELEFYIERDEMAIKAIEQEPRWIPVNEELPRTKQYALITVHNQTKMCWYQNGVFVDGEQIAYTKENEELVAWMSLPEPYKAESEDKE